ncbi:MAG TPA: sugar ABC transporter permease [Streptosporangiaceae bacterium]|jgi:multiple sugar transport system permease protein|nr:sugar ABC transporter permease [Streptosporangiaceae bacterium]
MTAVPAPARVRTPVRGQRRASGRGDGRVAMLFILPSLVGFLVFYVTPLIRGIYQSLTEYNILQAPTFIGLGNYRQLYHDPVFWNSLKVTAEYVAINISTQMIGALGIAVLMERLTRSVFVRCALVFPWLVPNVAVATISLFMLDRTVGVVNHLLTDLHLPAQYFYQSPHEAIATVALVNTWRNVGYTALLLFAGMQTIPKYLYEAAAIDGASEWRIFRSITLPLLRPILALVLTVSVIGSFQIYDTVSVAYQTPLPQAYVLYYYIYTAAFGELRMGYASAMAVVLFAILAVFTFIQLRLLRASRSDLA